MEEYPYSPRKRDAFDTHLSLSLMIESEYKKRVSDPKALQKTIDYCLRLIAFSEQAKQAWISECIRLGGDTKLPVHRGYERLCIILEKQKKFDEAIELSISAKKQGWNGNWDKRIERLRNKLNK